MADIELVVKISEKTINDIKDNAMFAKPIADHIKWDVTSAIVNGTPLPKGHGRIGDLDALANEIPIDVCDGFEVTDIIETAPTIIEADKEQE